LGCAFPSREEYRLRDLIERLDLALDTYIDRAVVEEAAAYLNELYVATTRKARPADIREKHPKDKAMMKFSHQWKQSRMIAGVPMCHGVYDYDEILREAIRVALRTNISADDDWDDRYTRIRQLMTAYITSPEGQGEDSSVLMARLAACIADVVPARQCGEN
jgi:hypothetical protein